MASVELKRSREQKEVHAVWSCVGVGVYGGHWANHCGMESPAHGRIPPHMNALLPSADNPIPSCKNPTPENDAHKITQPHQNTAHATKTAAVSGQGGETTEVTIGLPQGSLASVRFAIYIAETREAMDDKVEGSRGISLQRMWFGWWEPTVSTTWCRRSSNAAAITASRGPRRMQSALSRQRPKPCFFPGSANTGARKAKRVCESGTKRSSSLKILSGG